jgi:hypothetical protein
MVMLSQKLRDTIREFNTLLEDVTDEVDRTYINLRDNGVILRTLAKQGDRD